MSSPEGTRDGLGSVPAQMEDAEKRKSVQYTARRLVCVPSLLIVHLPTTTTYHTTILLEYFEYRARPSSI